MNSVNKVILIGHLGSDPEVRYIDRGVGIATCSVATHERSYTLSDGTQVADHLEWHTVVLWRQQAEWAEQYLKKGMLVYVEGKLHTHRWEKDGVIRQRTEIIADNMRILAFPKDEEKSPE